MKIHSGLKFIAGVYTGLVLGNFAFNTIEIVYAHTKSRQHQCLEEKTQEWINYRDEKITNLIGFSNYKPFNPHNISDRPLELHCRHKK